MSYSPNHDAFMPTRLYRRRNNTERILRTADDTDSHSNTFARKAQMHISNEYSLKKILGSNQRTSAIGTRTSSAHKHTLTKKFGRTGIQPLTWAALIAAIDLASKQNSWPCECHNDLCSTAMLQNQSSVNRLYLNSARGFFLSRYVFPYRWFYVLTLFNN